VTEDQVPEIVAAHLEAFRGEWDFREPTEDDIAEVIDDPLRDISLWKVAWAGDVVVGQVKPFINAEENAERGTLRGYTEYISTHRDWRNRGIAGALLAKSLRELRDRGMTEAVLGVDTNNPGGAFQLYTRLGFELQSYEAIYTRAATDAALPG
jgi:mycothiol synthase